MPRIVLCLLLAVLSTSVAAREVKMSSPDGGGYADAEPVATATGAAAPAPASGTVAALVGESRHGLRPDVEPHSVPGVRWHSFLPGMYRLYHGAGRSGTGALPTRLLISIVHPAPPVPAPTRSDRSRALAR